MATTIAGYSLFDPVVPDKDGYYSEIYGIIFAVIFSVYNNNMLVLMLLV